MDTLQGELQATYPSLRIWLLGINERGQEAGNAATTAGRDLPWLQDVDTNGNSLSDVARDLWDVTFRDVVILDGDNTQVGAYNLDDHNLAEPENYATLREMLVDAAMKSQLPWRNADNALDVDNSGVVIPLDVLIVVNQLNSVGSYTLPPPVEGQSAPPYYDCSGDGDLTPLDALMLVNYLNELPAFGAGEGESNSVSGEPSVGPHDAIPTLTSLSDTAGPETTNGNGGEGRQSDDTKEGRGVRDTPTPEAVDGFLAAELAQPSRRSTTGPTVAPDSSSPKPDDWFASPSLKDATKALGSPIGYFVEPGWFT
jgi:hypothetical protein